MTWQDKFAVYKVCIMRGLHWVQFPCVVFLVGAKAQQLGEEFWGIPLPIKYTVPLMLLLTWLAGRIELMMGLMQAEIGRNASLNPYMVGRFDDLEKLIKEIAK